MKTIIAAIAIIVLASFAANWYQVHEQMVFEHGMAAGEAAYRDKLDRARHTGDYIKCLMESIRK